jgi:hypothetical protein
VELDFLGGAKSAKPLNLFKNQKHLQRDKEEGEIFV